MAGSKHSSKLFLFALVALIGGAAGYGFYSQSTNASAQKEAPTSGEVSAEYRSIIAPKPTDIILGDSNALVTVVEYNSLSCTHCAHFHADVLPALQKQFITTGKVKLVLRHFPLNEPALKAAEIVECAGLNGLDRANFMKVFFNLQQQWAFGESFTQDLKQIALVGGIDSAAFDSCMGDKTLETRILQGRKDAGDVLGVNSTPSFFINGARYTGAPSVEGLSQAISAALPGAK